MDSTTERLIALQDLMQLKRDLGDARYEDLGFAPPDPAAVDAEVEALRAEIDPALLKRFDTVARRYERPLVPVRRGVCFGCFVQFPTARLNELESGVGGRTCEGCGRILYRIH